MEYLAVAKNSYYLILYFHALKIVNFENVFKFLIQMQLNKRFIPI